MKCFLKGSSFFIGVINFKITELLCGPQDQLKEYEDTLFLESFYAEEVKSIP